MTLRILVACTALIGAFASRVNMETTLHVQAEVVAPSWDGCQCDGSGDYGKGAMFCNAQAAGKDHFFDCSLSPTANKCFESIYTGESKKCDCLASCPSDTDLLRGQKKSACLACENPEPLQDLCPNYDDAHSWCSYYATWMCLQEQDECQHRSPDEWETNCLKETTGKTPDDRLDSFLFCLGKYSHP